MTNINPRNFLRNLVRYETRTAARRLESKWREYCKQYLVVSLIWVYLTFVLTFVAYMASTPPLDHPKRDILRALSHDVVGIFSSLIECPGVDVTVVNAVAAGLLAGALTLLGVLEYVDRPRLPMPWPSTIAMAVNIVAEMVGIFCVLQNGWIELTGVLSLADIKWRRLVIIMAYLAIFFCCVVVVCFDFRRVRRFLESMYPEERLRRWAQVASPPGTILQQPRHATRARTVW